MKIRALVAAMALAFAAHFAVTGAEARPRHHHHRALGAGQPAACAGIAWCGCWLRLRFGINDARLNAAREWAHVGAPAGGPGRNVIAVWAHHVGLITDYLGDGMIMLLSGNDGNAVKERPRSTRGIIAYRKLG